MKRYYQVAKWEDRKVTGWFEPVLASDCCEAHNMSRGQYAPTYKRAKGERAFVKVCNTGEILKLTAIQSDPNCKFEWTEWKEVIP